MKPAAGRQSPRPALLTSVAPERRVARTFPFRQFILKVHSRCNLACDYCYIYEMADQTWKSRPPLMKHPTVVRVAQRIAEHANAHDVTAIQVIFHGGEPLLAGPNHLAGMATEIRETVPAHVAIDFSVQTNGVLLDEALLDMLLDHRIRVGISLDGDRHAHDRHRRYANRRGSYDDVTNAVRLLQRERYRRLYSGLLCTIDLANDPVTTYEALLDLTPPKLNFLLPLGNWTTPPPGRPDDLTTPYADWLIRVFDRWYRAPRQETRIRVFEDIIHLLMGGRSGSEAVGLTPTSAITVDTDGSLEQVDALRSAYHGAAGTGLNVFEHDFDAALAHPAVAARQAAAALSATCRRCQVLDVCGGGYYPHRYRAGSGFKNPSVYCVDLQRLIEHIRRQVQADLQKLLRQPVGSQE